MFNEPSEEMLLREAVRIGQAMSRLRTNIDFVLVFKTMFVANRQELSIRKLISNDELVRAGAIKELEVIAHMQEYFDMLEEDAKKASEALLELNA